MRRAHSVRSFDMLDRENIDSKAFAEAARRVALEEKISDGFSVYAERAVHKTFKLYLEPRAECHEVPLMGSVCDILNERGVTEVQTGSLAPLIPKLRRLIKEHKVTLVHPFAIHTRHRWLDRATGEITEPGRRGTERTIHSVAKDLYAIRELIENENLTVVILAYECEEFRALDGRGRDRKRGATLLGKHPVRLLGELKLSSREDYLEFLPDALGEQFTMAEYLKAIKGRSRYDTLALKLLMHLGFVRQIGKRGRAFLYERCRGICVF